MKKINFEQLRVSISGYEQPFPDWACTAVQLGSYARYASTFSEKCRLIICCVVPCRDVFTALVGLGSVFAGGFLFKRSFGWEDLICLAPGTEIFWKNKGENHNYSGILEPHEQIGGQTLVPVSIKKPQKKAGRWYFSESKFRDCVFSEENLPSTQSNEWLKNVEDFYSDLGVENVSKWLVNAGPEVRFVTNNSQFRRTLDNWLITNELNANPLSPERLMLLRDEAESTFGKARLTNHLGKFIRECPVTILDGPLAFQCIPDIEFGSLVVILETGELANHHIDFLMNASDEHSLDNELLFSDFAMNDVPPSVQITGYCLAMV